MSGKLTKTRIGLLSVLMLSCLIISGCNEDNDSTQVSNSNVSNGSNDPAALMEPVHAPEPLSAALFGIGAAAVALGRKKRRRS